MAFPGGSRLLRRIGTAAVDLRKYGGAGGTGRDIPLPRLRHTGAVPLFRGGAASVGTGCGGGAGPGGRPAVPAALLHRRCRRRRVSAGTAGRVSRRRKGRGKPCAAGAPLPGGRCAAADLLQQRRASVYSGHRGRRCVSQPPGRGMAIPPPRRLRHGGGAAPVPRRRGGETACCPPYRFGRPTAQRGRPGEKAARLPRRRVHRGGAERGACHGGRVRLRHLLSGAAASGGGSSRLAAAAGGGAAGADQRHFAPDAGPARLHHGGGAAGLGRTQRTRPDGSGAGRLRHLPAAVSARQGLAGRFIGGAGCRRMALGVVKRRTPPPHTQKRDGCAVSFSCLQFFRGCASALPLVVGDTLRLGGAGLLGCERQHHQRDDVGHHVVHRAGDVHGLQEVEAGIHIGQRPEQAEQQGRQRDAGGLPLAEDHNGQRQEAEAGHAVFEPPLGHAGGDEYDAAQAAQHTGDQDAGPAHLIDVDAHGVRRLGMFAAGHEAQTEAGLVQHHIGTDQQQQRHQHEPAELEGADVHHKRLLGAGVLDDGGHVIGVGGGVDGLDDDGGAGGAQHVQGRAHDGLVRLEVDAGHGQQAGIDGAQQRCGQQHHHDHHKGGGVGGHVAHGQRAAQRAHDHDALQAQVDDAGMLGEAAAQCHQDQHGGEDQRILQQQYHY